MVKSSIQQTRTVSRLRLGVVLPVDFYSRPTLTVARELLGKILRVREGRSWLSGRIVEDEAYLQNDPASHSYLGKTRRNASMFMGPATAYVYRIHQVYCINAVTNTGEAVLIRSLEPIMNVNLATNGPGRLCQALGVTKVKHDGLNFSSSEDIQIVDDDNWTLEDFELGISPRIGISKAVRKPYRFYIADNPHLSR